LYLKHINKLINKPINKLINKQEYGKLITKWIKIIV
jgi:ABC-type amino acid transport substrate-binding protein